ncbi:MAG: phytanoyl-CoA dioxygenase family protein [Rhizobiaceae bacterium]
MSANLTSKTNQITAALNWAESHFKFDSVKPVTDHPWAQTLSLQAAAGNAYLKVLPARGIANPHYHALKSVADRFSTAVPQLIASDVESGFFLYKDHKGEVLDSGWNTDLRKSALQVYANIQAEAVCDATLLNTLPSTRCQDQFALLLEFLEAHPEDAPKLDGSLSAAYFLGHQQAANYLSILAAARPAFEQLLTKGDRLALTINHCDLRVKNIARRADDSLVIFDWDDAVAAPPGLSHHALFSGSYRPLVALSMDVAKDNSRARRDRDVLLHYMERLSATGHYDIDQLRDCLPATICAGVMRYLLSFAEYPVADEKLRRTIGKNMARRFSDLLDVAQSLMSSEKFADNHHSFAQALRESGRDKRAKQFEIAAKTDNHQPKAAMSDSDWMKAQLQHSDAEGVFPTLTVSDDELRAGKMLPRSTDLAVAMFKRHGTLMLENAIPVELVQQCHSEFMGKYQRYFHDDRHDDALRVGDKRFMITVEFDGGFAQPNLFASPFITPMLSQLLTPEFILGSLTAVASLPGSADQRLHKDNQALFPEVDDGILPSFSIAMIVPLIPLDRQTGATRVVKGSHRHSSSVSKTMPQQDPTVPLGSCFFMDSRLSHQGLANNSTFVRPIASLVYQRPWYQDNLNYKKQKPLNINAQQADMVCDDLKHLVEWAV